MIVRSLLHLLAPGGASGALTTLIFHRVLDKPDPLFPHEVCEQQFDDICRWMRAWCNVLPLDQAAELLQQGSLPPRAAAITFDDGYADNFSRALPILVRHGLPATFFVATGFLDGGRMWNDTIIEGVRATSRSSLDLGDLELGVHRVDTLDARRAAIDRLLPQVKYQAPEARLRTAEEIARRCGCALPADLMMTSAQVRAMHDAGMAIGGHTVNHPILAVLDDHAARTEIRENKARLEALTGAPLRVFAYPNGRPGKDYTARHATLVREAGYAAAVSTSAGVAQVGADRYQLPRFTPWDRRPLRFGLRLAGNLRRRAFDVA